MSAKPIYLLALIALAFAGTNLFAGQSASPSASANPDADNLPPGARMRFGADRFRSEGGVQGAPVFSPDGKSIASGGSDALVHFWDVASGIERSTLTGHQSEIYSLAYSADGSALASASGDGKRRVCRPCKPGTCCR